MKLGFPQSTYTADNSWSG